MPLVKSRPLTPAQRFFTRNRPEVHKGGPESSLTESLHRKKGRNTYGRITSRRRGGGHKRLYRQIDFHRNRFEDEATILRLEYDPNRSAHIALIEYADGEKRYILAPRNVQEGDTVINHTKPAFEFINGHTFLLGHIPPGTRVHAVELQPGRGACMVRGAGTFATVMAVDGGRVTLRMPSGEVRYVNERCRATIGAVSNPAHMNQTIGKAGRNRWKGRRPRVRGVAMNPVDHPMGGGEGRTSGGGHPVSPWGQLAKGFPTRKKSKTTNSMIVTRRNGRQMKR